MLKVKDIPWIADILKNHPEMENETCEPYENPKGKQALQDELIDLILSPECKENQEILQQVNDFRIRHLLRISVAEIACGLPLMRVSDHLTFLAEAIIGAVVEKAWTQLTTRYGTPACVLSDNICDMGFIVVAYGKFGGIEMGYGSDLDLVFLHAGNWQDTSGGERCIDSTQFYTKMGQQVLGLLGGQTIDGALYETDMRLRPDGLKGILVQQIESYRNYLADRAWTWEHQALVRARAVLGDPEVILRFEAIRREILTMERDGGKIKKEVTDMRHKMIRELDKSKHGLFDLKKGRGGIVDIEFLTQYLILLYAHEYPALAEWTDIVRILESLRKVDILSELSAHTLRDAYLSYRSHIHHQYLQNKSNLIDEKPLAHVREKVKSLYENYLGYD